MKQFYYPIGEVLAEAEEKSIYKSRSIGMQLKDSPVSPDDMVISEEDRQLCMEYLKTASDNIFSRIRTLLKTEDGRLPYEFNPEKNRVVYNLNLPKYFDTAVLPILYTAIKDYMVESILEGFYEETGVDKLMIMSREKTKRLWDKIVQYRIARTRAIRTGYNIM